MAGRSDELTGLTGPTEVGPYSVIEGPTEVGRYTATRLARLKSGPTSFYRMVRSRPDACSPRSPRARPPLEIPLLDLLSQVVGGAPRERQDGQRRVLLTGAREGGAVDDEHVFHLVHLVECVQGRPLRVFAHSTAAVLVDGGAVVVEHATLEVHPLDPGGLADLFERVEYVLRHLPLVVADGVVDPEHRRTVAIGLRRIHRDPVMAVGECLAERMQFDPRGVVALHVALEVGAEPRDPLRECRQVRRL